MVAANDIEAEVRRILVMPKQVAMTKEVLGGTGMHLSEELHDAEVEYTADLIRAAQFPVTDIELAILADDEKLVEFCREYIKAQPALDLGEEYNPDEPPEEDEPSNEEYGGHSQTYLLQYITLFLVLKNTPDRLLAYLKKIREPHAARQAKLLRAFFDEFQRRQ